MANSLRIARTRRGLTLVELLMVVVILALLLTVAVPMVRPAFQDRQLREAARQINAFFTGAQTRAAEAGRPVGVWIERFDDGEIGSRVGARLYMAEVAPAYTGTTLGAVVRVTVESLVPPRGRLVFSDLSDEAVLRTIVAPNEKFTIQFDYKGHEYSGLRLGDVFLIEIPLGIPPGAAVGGPGLSYQITRGPVRSAVSPLTLPADSVIDLSVSGIGRAGREFDSSLVAPWTATPIIIMFAPTGRVDELYLANTSVHPYSPIHLLVGRRAKVVNPTVTDVWDPEIANLADPANLWVTISQRTGSVTTATNVDTSWIPPAGSPPPLDPSDRVVAARELARTSVQKGGR
jgi:type II secretion system protein H